MLTETVIESGQSISAAARYFRKEVALVSPSGRETFDQLNRNANQVGHALRALGFNAGDRIGVLSYNRAEVVHCWLGFDKFQYVRMALHSHFPPATHAQTLARVGARALVFDTRFAPVLEPHLDDLAGVTLLAIGDDVPSWATPLADLTAGAEDADPLLDCPESTTYHIQPTSGTTGPPKLWAISHRAYLAMVEQNLHHLDTFDDGPALGPRDVCLHVHAVQWASGAHNLYPHLLRGARTVLLDDESFDPAAVVDAIVGHRVTTMFVPGPMLDPLLDEVNRRGGVDHELRRVIVFFGTPELLSRTTEVLGPVWCHGYGSSEQGGVATRLLARDVITDPRRASSVGRPASPFFQIAVVDQDGRRVSAGEVGEIVSRSAMSVGRYVDDDVSAPYLDGGWFRPRDVGYLDEDGFLYYLDRATDALQVGGRTVYPHVVESVVLQHEAVGSCGVVAVGDRVVAAVITRTGHEPDQELALAVRNRANSQLRAHEQIHEVLFVDSLPTVLSGAKVQRAALRQELLASGLVSA